MRLVIGNRRFRRQMQAGVVSGVYPLRVVGSQASGFSLAAERTTGKSVALFGPSFRRQTDAVSHGQDRFGLKAKKVVQGSRKAA